MGVWGAESATSKHNVFDPDSFSRVDPLKILWQGSQEVNKNTLLLGVDGGGTRCRVRLCAPSGAVLGEETGGPAHIRVGLEQGFFAVLHATSPCLEQGGPSSRDLTRLVACLALARAREPGGLR